MIPRAAVAEQEKTSEIDKIFSWATPNAPGCAVAVAQNEELVVNRAYGSADLERDVPISPDSIFDVASIRKQFVAAAVLLLVKEGRLSLSDDVRKFIPELPDYGHTITLDHLLTLTSGLRDWIPLRDWANGSYDVIFQRGMITVRFQREEAGKVVSFDFSNPALRHIKFTRLSDRTSGR